MRFKNIPSYFSPKLWLRATLLLVMLGIGMSLFFRLGLASDSSTEAIIWVWRVNLRGGPGTNYPVVGHVQAGDRLPVIGRTEVSGTVWYLVNAPEVGVVWIAGWTVKIKGHTPIPPITLTPTSPEMTSILSPTSTQMTLPNGTGTPPALTSPTASTTGTQPMTATPEFPPSSTPPSPPTVGPSPTPQPPAPTLPPPPTIPSGGCADACG
jgi:hypothetical protein